MLYICTYIYNVMYNTADKHEEKPSEATVYYAEHGRVKPHALHRASMPARAK